MLTALKSIFGGGISDTLKLAEALGAFFQEITNVHMWESLGWIALGIILILLGAWWWVGRPTPAPIPIPV